LLEIGRTPRDVNVSRDDAAGCRTSKQLVRDGAELVEGVRVGAGCGTTSSKLQRVHATAKLATRTPNTARRTGHVKRSEKDLRIEKIWMGVRKVKKRIRKRRRALGGRCLTYI
jgi:hypothetical protein